MEACLAEVSDFIEDGEFTRATVIKAIKAAAFDADDAIAMLLDGGKYTFRDSYLGCIVCGVHVWNVLSVLYV